jgi:hypothetical protein
MGRIPSFLARWLLSSQSILTKRKWLFYLEYIRVLGQMPHRWCLHLIVVVGFESSRDPQSYAGGSVATGRVIHARQIKG